MDGYFADVEPLSSCLRVYPDGSDRDRDPFVMAASVLWHDRNTAELKGVWRERRKDGEPVDDPSDFIHYRRAICLALYRMGADWMVWTRKRTDGRPDRVVRVPVKRWAIAS